MTETVVRMYAITKTFPGGVTANRDASLDVRKGEIHAVVGENGAGKSTLMNILYGLLQPDSGEIWACGRKVSIPNPRVAKKLGIGMVHQHFMLVSSFTVLQNIILGYEPRRYGYYLDREAALREVQELCERYHMDLPLHSRLADIPVGLQQRVEIMKAIYRGAETLILDEPTAVLTPLEVQELFGICREMTAQDKTIIFISHKLREVLSLCGRITVMRSGQTLQTLNSSETDEKQLANLIVGRDRIWSIPVHKKQQATDEVLRVDSIAVRSRQNTWAVKDISLCLRKGEILGIAGVEGNGQTELAGAVAGLLPVEKGHIYLNGEEITGQSIAQRRSQGLRHIPEDRLEVGACLKASIAENLIVDPNDRKKFIRPGGLIDWPAVIAYAGKKIREFNVLAPGPMTKAGELSGGNLQKVVAARELEENERCLIVLHPTRGLDIGAAEFIYERLAEARANECGVLLVSADLDEIFMICDRIVVIYEGQVVAEFQPDQASPELVGLYMTGAGRTASEGDHE